MKYEANEIEAYLPAVCWTHHTRRRGHRCIRDESLWITPPTVERKASIDPAVWRSFSEAQINESACDPATRKGTIDPSHSNAAWASLADIQVAWDRADLDQFERQILFLHYSGFKWKQSEIADHYGIDQSTVSRRLTQATERLLDAIN